MLEKMTNDQDKNKKEEQPRILLPEELKKIMEAQSPESTKTKGRDSFLQKELGEKRSLLNRMKEKGLGTASVERDIERMERELGGGHA